MVGWLVALVVGLVGVDLLLLLFLNRIKPTKRRNLTKEKEKATKKREGIQLSRVESPPHGVPHIEPTRPNNTTRAVQHGSTNNEDTGQDDTHMRRDTRTSQLDASEWPDRNSTDSDRRAHTHNERNIPPPVYRIGWCVPRVRSCGGMFRFLLVLRRHPFCCSVGPCVSQWRFDLRFPLLTSLHFFSCCVAPSRRSPRICLVWKASMEPRSQHTQGEGGTRGRWQACIFDREQFVFSGRRSSFFPCRYGRVMCCCCCCR